MLNGLESCVLAEVVSGAVIFRQFKLLEFLFILSIYRPPSKILRVVMAGME